MHILMRFPEGKAKALTLSYDDGGAQDMRLVDIMSRYGLKGTFNINTGCIPAEDAVGGKGKMSEKQISDTYKNPGVEVAVHTYTHPHLEEMSPASVCKEVLDDRAEIERIFGGVIRGMAYPYGSYNDEVVDALRSCGIAYSRTVESTHNFNIPTDWLRMPATCHHNDPKLFELAETFLQDIQWYHKSKLFYLWGHSYEFDNDDNWEVIEKFAQLTGNRDDVWYATNIEVYDYVNAYNNLQYNIAQTVVYNPSTIDVWIAFDQKVIKAEAGKYTNI